GLLGLAVHGLPAGLDELRLLEERQRLQAGLAELLLDGRGGEPAVDEALKHVALHVRIKGPEDGHQIGGLGDHFDSAHRETMSVDRLKASEVVLTAGRTKSLGETAKRPSPRSRARACQRGPISIRLLCLL